MDDPRLRVGDADRERVVDQLQRAVGAGMITLDEFEVRMDAALRARTRGELAPITGDLPSDPHATSVTSADPTVLPLTVTMSSVTRKGPWHVPGAVTVRSRFSSVTLDLTEADVRSRVVSFEIDDVCSSITVVLPDDATADLTALRCLGSSADSSVGAAPSGRVHVVVSGRLRFGSLSVRHSYGAWLRRRLR